jgi:hypothetical protein
MNKTKNQSWAKALTEHLIIRMARVQLHAAYRVQQNGGHKIAQASAAVAARTCLLDGDSAASAIYNGVKAGMHINATLTRMQSC